MASVGAAQFPSYVPQQYTGIVGEGATGTGLPIAVVASQIEQESTFNPNAVSSAGAEGMFQFLPSTAASYGGGNLFDPAQEVKDYINYMNALLKQEGGSVFKALEAYNAGPGNLSAGSGYASAILSRAGASQSLSSFGGTGASAASGTSPGSGGSGATGGGSVQLTAAGVGNVGNDILQGFLGGLLGDFGIGNVKDMLERLGLLILGVIILVVGINILTRGTAKQTFNINMPQQQAGQETNTNTTSSHNTKSTTNRNTNAPIRRRGMGTPGTAGATSTGGLAADSVEAAAIA